MMKKFFKPLLASLCGLLFCPVFSQTATSSTPDYLAMLNKNELDYVYTSYVDARIRQLALNDRQKLEQKLLLNPKEWQQTFADFSEELFRDFFVGTVLLRGKVNSVGACESVAGFYNPWWDVILLVKSISVNEKIDKEEIVIRKIKEVSLLTGATFREEGKAAATGSIQYFMKPDQYISYKVSDLFSRTRQMFDKYYADSCLIHYKHQLRDNRRKEENQLINAISYVRLKQADLLIANKTDHDEAWRIADALHRGTNKIFDLMFSSEYAKMMNSAFVQLPPVVRKGFQPYGYYPATEQGSKVRCYIYINTDYPRLFAITYLGLGYRKTVFEWFDFEKADEICQKFREEEERKAKQAGKDGAK